jgi:predicted metal-dependent peptidase
MKAIDRLKRSKIDIIKHKEFCRFGGVLGVHVIDNSINPPTACTNGMNVKFHEKFVDSLSDPELRLVVLHEAMHNAFRHFHVWRNLWKENPKLANIAADHFVNLALIDMDNDSGFLKMPELGVQPEPKYRGWDVKRIFDDLKQQPDNGNGQGEGDGGGMDGHDWEEAQSMSQEEVDRQAKEIDKALRQGEMIAKKLGSGKGNRKGVFGDLLNAKIDWRQALREFVQTTCQGRDESTWRKPNRRYLSSDTYMPSMYSEKMGDLVIGMDTSGSCFGSEEMTRFVSEIKSIVEAVAPERVRVVYWDSAVQGEQVFEDGQFEVSNVRPQGGGGTNGSVLFDYLRQQQIRPQAIVQFTDGYVGNWGTTGVPTLWAVTSDQVAPFGTTIRVEV